MTVTTVYIKLCLCLLIFFAVCVCVCIYIYICIYFFNSSGFIDDYNEQSQPWQHLTLLFPLLYLTRSWRKPYQCRTGTSLGTSSPVCCRDVTSAMILRKSLQTFWCIDHCILSNPTAISDISNT